MYKYDVSPYFKEIEADSNIFFSNAIIHIWMLDPPHGYLSAHSKHNFSLVIAFKIHMHIHEK